MPEPDEVPRPVVTFGANFESRSFGLEPHSHLEAERNVRSGTPTCQAAGGNSAFVAHAHLANGFANNHAVLANKAEDATEHVKTAGAIVRIGQDKFVDVLASKPIRRTHADHVFRVFALDLIAYARLADHEGLEAFVAQPPEYVDGGDVGIALRAAIVLALGKDGRRDAADLVV